MRKSFFVTLLTIAFFSSCDKVNPDNILITLKYNGMPVEEATVALAGAISKQTCSDGNGQVYFGNLIDGNYKISVSGYVGEGKKYVHAEKDILVREQGRGGFNNIIIDLQ